MAGRIVTHRRKVAQLPEIPLRSRGAILQKSTQTLAGDLKILQTLADRMTRQNGGGRLAESTGARFDSDLRDPKIRAKTHVDADA